MYQGLVFGCIVGVRIHYLKYILDCLSGWGHQNDASPQARQHFGAVEVHDPVGVCALFFREFGFSPFGNEVGQNLRLNSSPWLVGYVEREELDGPFGNPTRCVVVVYNIIKRCFGCHYY